MQKVYANMEGNVLVHVAAPALGLSAGHWAVASWGESQLTRESVYDAKYIYRFLFSPIVTDATSTHTRCLHLCLP